MNLIGQLMLNKQTAYKQTPSFSGQPG